VLTVKNVVLPDASSSGKLGTLQIDKTIRKQNKVEMKSQHTTVVGSEWLWPCQWFQRGISVHCMFTISNLCISVANTLGWRAFISCALCSVLSG